MRGRLLLGAASSSLHLLLWLSSLLAGGVESRAILGVDLGSLYMKVALVQSGSPLEIVVNQHSKRKTEQMILFDRSQRFYGADAASLLARKASTTPAAMSLLLGRDEQHPVVQVLAERHFPVVPTYNESRSGVTMTIDGAEFTPEELVAMVLVHAVDIAVAHAASQGNDRIAPPKDVVLTAPSFATQHERRALLDAATLADLNVLEIIDENTAAAVQYAMDKKFDQEQLLLFYNMGASALQVSVIRFFAYDKPEKFGKPKSVPALEVLAKAWDATLGGDAFDHLLVEYLADQFNAAWYKTGRAAKGKDDVRKHLRAMTKLRIQANKVKHVLSANSEIPVYMDAVHDDVSLSAHISRDLLDELSAPLLERAVAPIRRALEIANRTASDLTGVELLGGGMRIPRVQAELQSALGEAVEVGMHMNADESMALGAAFVGANVSTAFRVRHVGLTDLNPFGVQVTLTDLPGQALPKDEEEEDWKKNAVIFKSFGKMGVKRTITFTHDRNVHCALDYVEEEPLPKGTNVSLERFNITGVAEFAKEMDEKNLTKPKVSLQFELGTSGITTLVRAEASVEETYTVEEEVEVDDEDASVNASADGEATNASASATPPAEGSNATAEANSTEPLNVTVANATKAKKPKKKILVPKEKKRVHRRPLTLAVYHEGPVQPHSPELLQASRDKLLDMAVRDKERIMLEEARNRLESYIYKVKNKLEDDAEAIAKVSTEEQRELCLKLARAAQEWMEEDGYGADYATMEDKYAELSAPFEKILLRLSELTARPAAVEALKKRLTEIEQLMEKWATERPQVTDEERAGVLEKVEGVRKWVSDQEEAQGAKEPHEDPAFLSSSVPGQTKVIEATVVRLSKKPKPKPAKNETKVDANATSSGSNATADGNATSASPDGTNSTAMPADGGGNGTAEATANTTGAAEADAGEEL